MDENSGSPGAGRVVLLTTSHRVAPGLLSWRAWETLRGADAVLCPDPEHPQLPYLREAGVAVEHGRVTGRELVDRAAGGRTAVYLPDAGGDPALTDELAALAGSGRVRMPELELLPGCYDLPGARLLDLVQVMDRIRAECPWSSTRTGEGLVPYLIEEAYELVEAIETGDRDAYREELGDVLLQVVFHARIAQDDAERPFGIDEVAGGIVEKLVRRHPHVFGGERAETPEQVQEHWLRTKDAEKRRGSATDGIPLDQPALALAAKLAARARRAGLDLAAGDPAPDADPGDRLLALAAEAQRAGADPESALRAAARRYRDAIRAAESAR